VTSDHSVSKASEEEKSYIRRRLIEYNSEHIPEELKSRYEEINLTVKDGDGNILGGLIGVLCWNWVEVDILWVDPGCRKQGCGKELLSKVETIAAERNCTFIKLNTFSFQAPGFYRKNGYVEEYASLEEAPTGHTHHYFKKDIANAVNIP
jgi:GNAT superfamily N-acetyltransferase